MKKVLQRIQEDKKKIFTIMIGLLIVSSIFTSLILDQKDKILKTLQNYKKLSVKTQAFFMEDVIREQQRRFLTSVIRQGWINYFKHFDTEILKHDDEGNILFETYEGKVLAYDKDEMKLSMRYDDYYNIHNKETGEILLKRARPIWDTKKLNKVFSIIGGGYKAFGTTGDLIIYDSYTGQMILDNSEDCRTMPEVVAPNGKRYLTLDEKHKNNANPSMTEKVIDEEMMWRTDTSRGDGMVYYFSEPYDFNNGINANNFRKNPLGDYKREFQEKILLLYDGVSLKKQFELQITVISGTQEPELMEGHEEVERLYKNIKKDFESYIISKIIIPLMFPIIILVMLALTSYYFYSVEYELRNLKDDKKDN